jgi:hypothetical protein
MDSLVVRSRHDLAAAGFPVRSTHDELYTLALAAEACAGLGDAKRAAVLADRLTPHQELIAHVTAATGGAVSHYLGLLATTLRRFDEAEVRFEVMGRSRWTIRSTASRSRPPRPVPTTL